MWDFFNSREVVAAKPHRCAECRGVIAKGEMHLSCSGKVDGYFDAYRLCLDCALISSEGMHADLFDPEGFPLGACREVLADEHDIVDALAWAKSRRETRLLHERVAAENRQMRETIGAIAIEIGDERLRQIAVEGYATDHDDMHRFGSIAKAGSAYAEFASLQPALRKFNGPGLPPPNWPWEPQFWKPSEPRRELIKAAALIVAEIERIDRAAGKATAEDML